MTVSSTLEAKLRDRGSSSTPAQAVETVLHVEPSDDAGETRLNEVAHWGYGTSMGVLRGLLATIGLRGPVATGAHLALVVGAENTVLPGLDLSPPAWEWEATEIGVDLLHHAVYAVATGLMFDWLDG
jgi:hypothetical protein